MLKVSRYDRITNECKFGREIRRMEYIPQILKNMGMKSYRKLNTVNLDIHSFESFIRFTLTLHLAIVKIRQISYFILNM